MSIFGRVLRVSTFGESHSAAVGCTIEGFPSNFRIDFQKVQQELNRRRPGQSSITTARKQADTLKVLSGIQHDRTLGSPITLVVQNQDFKAGDYSRFSNVPRPGHADFTYKAKYGIVAESGGGRSSARETVGRVMAGALCKQYLNQLGVICSSWVYSVGGISIDEHLNNELITKKTISHQVDELGTLIRHESGFAINGKFYDSEFNLTQQSNVGKLLEVHVTRCPSQLTALRIVKAIKEAKQKQDSIGGVVQGCIYNLPIGLGRPVFDKFPALMSHAMLSIPATKGFQYGSGFSSTLLSGSQHNDLFRVSPNGNLKLKTNNSGGTLGGITTGQPFNFKVAFKPPSTIGVRQVTANYYGEEVQLQGHGRHDPCVLPRAPPIVDAMSCIVVMDEILQFNSTR